MSRLEWLDKQIAVQTEALVKAKTIEAARTHSYLLEKLTDECIKRRTP